MTAAGGVLRWGVLADVTAGGAVCPVCVACVTVGGGVCPVCVACAAWSLSSGSSGFITGVSPVTSSRDARSS